MDVADSLHHFTAMKDHGEVNIGATPHESLRHHANDGADFVVEMKLATDDAGVAAELPLPELVAEDDDRFGAGIGIAGQRDPPEKGRHAHHIESVHGDVIAAQAFRLTGASPDYVANGG